MIARMPQRSNSPTETGFTLIEMMIALFIFALIAGAGVALLSVGVRAQAAATTRLDDVADLRRMSVLLANDLSQIVPRTARSTNGATLRAFTGNDGTSDPLVLGYVRGGRSNLDDAPRANLQRVDIVLDGNRLERRGYAAIDGTADVKTVVLADRVTALAMRYRDAKGVWRARWDNALLDALPVAVEMTVTRANGAPLTFAFAAGPLSL